MTLNELLDSEEKWTKEADARTVDGESVDYDDPGAVCWCLSGAIWKTYVERHTVIVKICESISTLFPDEYPKVPSPYVIWNDLPTTTFEKVKRVLEHANV